MEENIFRVIKISKKALYEFIYEKFIEDQELYMKVQPEEVMNSFNIDYVNGEFIFMAHQAEDSKGNILPFPAEIDLEKVMANMKDTTTSMFSEERYQDYTLEELHEIQSRVSR